jgi:hypothetical protein
MGSLSLNRGSIGGAGGAVPLSATLRCPSQDGWRTDDVRKRPNRYLQREKRCGKGGGLAVSVFGRRQLFMSQLRPA